MCASSARDVLAVTILLCMPRVVAAQPTFTESFFVSPVTGAGAHADALDACAFSFAAALTSSGSFLERNSPEIAEAVSQCVEDTSSPTFARECELAVTTSEVDYVVLVAMQELAPAQYVFEASARSTQLNAGVWAGDTNAAGNPEAVARDACETLGREFLASRGVETSVSQPGPPSATPPPGSPTAPDRAGVDVLLRIDDEGPFEATLVAADASLRSCSQPLTRAQPCPLASVPTGSATVHFEGSRDFEATALVLDVPTELSLDVQGRSRQGQRIAGPILALFGGFSFGFIASVGEIDFEGGSSIPVVLGPIMFVTGIAMTINGLNGPHRYELDAAPLR